ncbi:MAG TPA: alkaline phosphatase PhoX [Nocardioidaceae bacterium]|nr:alkaline phosphatase PhoX [Nocardioidaceae bacterium]
MTCQYRCGNACDKPEANISGNPQFRGLVEETIARRSVLKASAAVAGALVLGGLATPPGIASAATVRAGETRLGKTGFRSVAPNVRDAVTLPQAFTHDVVVAWGDPVTSDAPAFDVERQTTASASRQFGYNCDYVGVLPLDDRRALLVANHEYTNPRLMFPLQYLQQ